ncbi:MAG: DUF3179 domain-containing protein [Calditrichaeota bacterium]|nr:MAG: DUF3179 domain-containing protein [Calditrichota bacterium]
MVQLAGVYSRVIDGKVLTLSASGWTYFDTFVLFDYETESLWYHLDGEEGLRCISGRYKDRKLREFPSEVVAWNNWFARHPETKYLVGGSGI